MRAARAVTWRLAFVMCSCMWLPACGAREDKVAAHESTYRAGAVQFTANASLLDAPSNVSLGDSLSRYQQFAAEASAAGVQVLVFPEATLWGFGFAPGTGTLEDRRARMRTFAEPVPAVGTAVCGAAHTGHLQLHTAACMAMTHNLVVAINIIDVQPCTNNEVGADSLQMCTGLQMCVCVLAP